MFEELRNYYFCGGYTSGVGFRVIRRYGESDVVYRRLCVSRQDRMVVAGLFQK